MPLKTAPMHASSTTIIFDVMSESPKNVFSNYYADPSVMQSDNV
jgi:hypothetical protein